MILRIQDRAVAAKAARLLIDQWLASEPGGMAVSIDAQADGSARVAAHYPPGQDHELTAILDEADGG